MREPLPPPAHTGAPLLVQGVALGESERTRDSRPPFEMRPIEA